MTTYLSRAADAVIALLDDAIELHDALVTDREAWLTAQVTNHPHGRTTMVNSPTNLTTEVRENPLLGLTVGLPGGIEASEAQGQRQLVQSAVLPTEILHSTKEEFEALGFVFGEPVKGDELFTEVTLPEGWGKAGTSHSMWSDVLDERGVKRVGVFYKAAFYDRRAHMSLTNVGRQLASDLHYADDPEIPASEKKPIDLAVFTSEEIEAARESLQATIASDQEYLDSGRCHDPKRYEGMIERAKAGLAKLEAHAAA